MNYAPRPVRSAPIAAPTQSLVSDALWKTYRWMAAGLGVTGLVAMGVASSETALNAIVGNRLVFYMLLFAQLGLVLVFNTAAARASTAVEPLGSGMAA